MDKELINIRYNHFEEKRKSYIELSKERRTQVISNPGQFRENNSDNKSTNLISGSTAVQEEQKRLERLKNKNVNIIFLS